MVVGTRVPIVVGTRVLIAVGTRVLIVVGTRVLIVVGTRVLRISLIPSVLRLRTGRRRHDGRADDCQRDERRMKSLHGLTSTLQTKNLSTVAIKESDKNYKQADW
jgi:hypothetical protein